MADSNSTAVQCLIGNNVELQGGLRFSGGLHVDGKIIGDVFINDKQSGHLVLSTNGIIEGNVTVSSAEVNGTIKGDIHVSGNLRLHSNAHVTGDVYYTGVEIQKGAMINGRLIAEQKATESDKAGFLKSLVGNKNEVEAVSDKKAAEA
jgi:cytoskeletal protein CcmA (bactofilin family)